MKLFPELHKRSRKAGHPPGTAVYIGEKKIAVPRITVITYDTHDFHETIGTKLTECLPAKKENGVTWINIEGLHDVDLVNQLAKIYDLHPLTVEDILNVEQRSKVEEFNDYIFITLRVLRWHAQNRTFSMDQMSLVFGKDFVLSFQESESTLFNTIRDRLRSGIGQRMREHGSDYSAYRLLDAVIDQYFVVLEGVGDEIERIEQLIISDPTPQNARVLHHLKRQVLLLRKAIWPVREAISHLAQTDSEFVKPFARVYLRDLYDHSVQALDTVETFRDMLGGMLDVYLSSLTTRLNEIMKVLTIIATIFIPVTFIASVYGMNFKYMPELNWPWGYPAALGLMLAIIVWMVVYFKRKKWL